MNCLSSENVHGAAKKNPAIKNCSWLNYLIDSKRVQVPYRTTFAVRAELARLATVPCFLSACRRSSRPLCVKCIRHKATPFCWGPRSPECIPCAPPTLELTHTQNHTQIPATGNVLMILQFYIWPFSLILGTFSVSSYTNTTHVVVAFVLSCAL